MASPLEEVKDYYIPECSVDSGFTTSNYGGLAKSLLKGMDEVH